MTSPTDSHAILLFIGDSITDCDRRTPEHAPFGWGYVRLLRELLILRQPHRSFTIMNRGIGGNTVGDLGSRWREDVLLHRPDVLVVKIGINDLNEFLCKPEKAFLSPQGFAAMHEKLLARTRDDLPTTRMLVLSPFYLSSDSAEYSYRTKVLQILPEYITAARESAARHSATFIDLHAVFQERLRYHHPDVYCAEPVHPNHTGHLVIADAVYTAITG